jgi:hypothetical protein
MGLTDDVALSGNRCRCHWLVSGYHDDLHSCSVALAFDNAHMYFKSDRVSLMLPLLARQEGFQTFDKVESLFSTYNKPLASIVVKAKDFETAINNVMGIIDEGSAVTASISKEGLQVQCKSGYGQAKDSIIGTGRTGAATITFELNSVGEIISKLSEEITFEIYDKICKFVYTKNSRSFYFFSVAYTKK